MSNVHIISFNSDQTATRLRSPGCGRWIDRVVLQYHTIQAFGNPYSNLTISWNLLEVRATGLTSVIGITGAFGNMNLTSGNLFRRRQFSASHIQPTPLLSSNIREQFVPTSGLSVDLPVTKTMSYNDSGRMSRYRIYNQWSRTGHDSGESGITRLADDIFSDSKM
jgi:hypothetical protein